MELMEVEEVEEDDDCGWRLGIVHSAGCVGKEREKITRNVN